MSVITVTTDGRLRFGGLDFRCALGRGGCVAEADKREGDGATPFGLYPLRQVLYRPDRLPAAPQTRLSCTALTPAAGWCDDPADAASNRQVALPPAGDRKSVGEGKRGSGR